MGLNNLIILGKKEKIYIYIYTYIYIYISQSVSTIMGLNNPILITKAPIVGLKKPHLDP